MGVIAPHCEHCGGGGSGRQVRRVQVRLVREPDAAPSHLMLCVSCVENEDRTWRLRWREVVR
jgi:hypothetical protein